MGKAVIILNVFPEQDADFDKISAELKKIPGYNTSSVEPFVFGTKKIKVSYVYEDGQKQVDYEEAISKISGVSGCQVEEESLL